MSYRNPLNKRKKAIQNNYKRSNANNDLHKNDDEIFDSNFSNSNTDNNNDYGTSNDFFE